jgi:hypothetical protein
LDFFQLSGFPSEGQKNVFYPFKAGWYSFEYELIEVSTSTGNGWWLVSYTVSFNPGELFANGDDKYFTVTCGLNGPIVTGADIVQTLAKAIGADGETIKEYRIGSDSITLKFRKIAGPTDPSGVIKLK